MGWPVMAEFVAEQVEGPIWILAAAQCFADQHAMPSDLLLDRVLLCAGLAGDHEAEFALLEIDIAGFRLRHPAAMAAGRLNHDRCARRTLAQLRLCAGLALL